ncbi:MAG: hypothetical protein K6F14_04640 [Clostridiales bacterium]|nr:hypothetical protein [Clostridiales bacterium]
MRITEFTQTPFVSHDNKNKVNICVENWDMCNPFQVFAYIDGQLVCSTSAFEKEFSLMLPAAYDDKKCTIKICPFEDVPFERSFTLKPIKKWMVSLIYSSHEDLGYCGYIEKLELEFYKTLKKAIELCEEHEDFKYMIEHVYWLNSFDSHASNEEKERLKILFKEKRIELNGIHSGVHTSWANNEQLVREMYYGCMDSKEKYGAEVKSAIYADISGVSQSVVNAYSTMGIKYMGALSNTFRNSEENKEIPPLFLWRDKSGNHEVLFWYQRSYRPLGLGSIWCDTKRHYAEGEFVFDETKMRRTEQWFTSKLNSLNRYGYSDFPLSFYDDRETPTTMLLTICKAMSDKWKYPVFKMDIPSAVLERVWNAGKDSLPELSGDITDQWADFATIAPQLFAEKRSVMRKLYNCEAISTILSIKNGTAYPSKVYSDAVWNLCNFDEHCWATSSKHPQEMHRHNLDVVKKKSVENAESALDNVFNGLDKNIDGKIRIVNTLPYKRDQYLISEEGAVIPKGMPHQVLPDRTIITHIQEIDGFTSKSFDSVLPYKQSVRIDTCYFETDYYAVELNPETKSIVNILDKGTNRLLIDENSEFELGQFIYTYSEGKKEQVSGYEVPKKQELSLYEGDICYVVIQRGHEEQSGADITAQFRFYKHEKNLDIDLSFENATGLMGDYYDRYKKNYFFAFPFSISQPRFYTEMQLGDKDESIDTLPINSNDFTVTQNYIASDNGEYGVAVYTRDMPVFHLGKIKYNRLQTNFSEEKAHLYLYAASNRCNNLVYTNPEQCRSKYSISVLPYTESRFPVVPRWSESKNRDFLVLKNLINLDSDISLKGDGVQLISFKKSEKDDSVILRFVNTNNESTKCSLELSFKPNRAMYTTCDEKEIEEALLKGKVVEFIADPYSYTTLKLVF